MRFLTMICAAALAICGTGRAQSSVDMITVHFSTPVMVAGTTLPAGDCTIQVLRGSSDNIVLAVRPESGKAVSVLVNRFSDSNTVTNGQASVILSRRDTGYHLDQILLPDHTGFQVLD
ncbi:MAG: hypothetical protein LAQ69_11965 [Acidobacteriia bacterium]|nr:hypothetical protein [Terriglobia bacterium]